MKLRMNWCSPTIQVIFFTIHVVLSLVVKRNWRYCANSFNARLVKGDCNWDYMWSGLGPFVLMMMSSDGHLFSGIASRWTTTNQCSSWSVSKTSASGQIRMVSDHGHWWPLVMQHFWSSCHCRLHEIWPVREKCSNWFGRLQLWRPKYWHIQRSQGKVNEGRIWRTLLVSPRRCSLGTFARWVHWQGRMPRQITDGLSQLWTSQRHAVTVLLRLWQGH